MRLERQAAGECFGKSKGNDHKKSKELRQKEKKYTIFLLSGIENGAYCQASTPKKQQVGLNGEIGLLFLHN